jgi:Endoplasmic Reticulum-Golgi Intermediate Compartment (ERGIC)
MEVDMLKTDTLRIEFDVSFPALPCQALRLDLGDVAGNFQTEGGIRIAQ